MNKSLLTFMMMAAIVSIMTYLILGTSFNAYKAKNNQYQDMLQNEHQIKIKL
ncbi:MULTISPECIES: hypothetical protein [Bacillaceae]|jgi:hypothetical protein|uniref:hypothetical protein n=1 Tax=Bacillaceae TaxID=186817 RepID=UPI0003001AB1|nr:MULTISPECIES: hypothetical protein [Bacillaceae]MDU1848226.1 hypothetical protein [Niallia nealsonii]SLL35124.1 Uncharacterised protein [Mycobacteroides abscessus subsp. abscessus]HEO8421300.1 hypothetical protein [Yersinia enterocolitica]MCM3364335.1 hypothetical protein [Niallia sp. MER TA 168]MED3795205.1 hypothetical protein [Niallia alba]